jgi:hypothetical protein
MSDLIDRLPKGYTPGPWKADAETDARGTWIECPGKPLSRYAALAVAWPDGNLEEERARAELIALAPEMATEIARLTTALAAAEAALAQTRFDLAYAAQIIGRQGETIAAERARAERLRLAAAHVVTDYPVAAFGSAMTDSKPYGSLRALAIEAGFATLLEAHAALGEQP